MFHNPELAAAVIKQVSSFRVIDHCKTGVGAYNISTVCKSQMCLCRRKPPQFVMTRNEASLTLQMFLYVTKPGRDKSLWPS